MSENRSRYSSAPLQDLRRRPPRQEAPRPASNHMPGINAPHQTLGNPKVNLVLQVLLVAVLPLLFLISLIFKWQQMQLIFIIASVLCLVLMMLFRAFVPNARQVLGVVHVAMIAVTAFALMVSGQPAQDNRTSLSQEQQSIFNNESTASLVDMERAQQQEAAESTEPGMASLAQQKLVLFMNAWGNKNYAEMVKYSDPKWVNSFQTQKDAESNIFYLAAIRTPTRFNILEVTGTDADQVRTINMQAYISKSDGKEPQLYNFQILMVRSNNEWYVDPASISSSQIVQETTSSGMSSEQMAQAAISEEQQQAQAQQVNQTRSDTVLYYNQDGGEFYHLDPNCATLGERYKPLTAMFYYRDVSNDTFKNLKACPVCKAPGR